jgi:hypothetical protein
LLCFAFLPQDIPDKIHVFYQRFSVFFFIGIIILGSVIVPKYLNRIIIPAVCSVCILHFVLWADYFRDFKKETSIFSEEFFPENAGEEKMAGLIFDYRFRGRPIYIHFPDYYIVWKQGIACTFIIDSGLGSFGSTKRKASKESLPEYLAWVGKHNDYDGRYNDMDYILSRGEISEEAKQYLNNFALIKKEGKWKLYHRKEHKSKVSIL